jgi:hypothetical protein
MMQLRNLLVVLRGLFYRSQILFGNALHKKLCFDKKKEWFKLQEQTKILKDKKNVHQFKSSRKRWNNIGIPILLVQPKGFRYHPTLATL